MGTGCEVEPSCAHLLQVEDAAGELDLLRAFLQECRQAGLLLLENGML